MSTGKEHPEIPENERPQEEGVDIAAEFAALGRKLVAAMDTAWNSEERHKIQGEIREGLNRFVTEVDRAVRELRETEAGKKVETGVQQVAEEVRSGKVAEEVRRGVVTALRSASEALDRMAGSFTPVEEKDAPKE